MISDESMKWIEAGKILSSNPKSTKFNKNVVIIVGNSVCAILTIVSIIAFIFSCDKRPFYIILPVVLFQDIVWILVYIFYVRKQHKVKTPIKVKI